MSTEETTRDRAILRDLAKQYAEACQKEVQKERRDLWRRHNSFHFTRPPIYIRAFAWREMADSRCECEDPFFRGYEDFFRRMRFLDTVDDDYIFEPWVTVSAVRITPPGGIWGLPVKWERPAMATGAGVWDAPIKEPEDLERMVASDHIIDEERTRQNVDRLHDAIGDILTISVDRGPVYQTFSGDISTHLAYLRGLEQIMWDMLDRPAFLHELLAFMRDGILQTHQVAEDKDDWALCNHQNQAMPYAEELDDPAANGGTVPRKQLWHFCASQELTGVSAQMFDEFMVQYQRPIIEQFAMSAYGCCEDLTDKIDVLRQINNLRRIAVAPAANVAKCAEQIGSDYILSYRPNPTDMVASDFDPERVRRILRRDFESCRGCCFDITLKDVETVQSDPERVRKWVQIVREVTEEVFG